MRFVLLAALAACQPTPQPLARPAHPALQQAHQAFLHNKPTVAEHVHTVLAANPSPEVQANALELLEATFERTPKLPSNQALPEGVNALSLQHMHRESPDGHTFRLSVRANTESQTTLTGITLRGPETREGTFTSIAEEGAGFAELELPDRNTPAPRGLYEIDLHGAFGTITLWTILTAHTASEAPQVAQPYPGQAIHTPFEVQFTPQSTPEHVQGEAADHTLWLGSRPSFAGRWSHWCDGACSSATLPSQEPGDYWLAVSHRETRQLGPVQIRRVATRGIPLTVR